MFLLNIDLKSLYFLNCKVFLGNGKKINEKQTLQMHPTNSSSSPDWAVCISNLPQTCYLVNNGLQCQILLPPPPLFWGSRHALGSLLLCMVGALCSVGKLHLLRCIFVPTASWVLLCAASAFTASPHEKNDSLAPQSSPHWDLYTLCCAGRSQGPYLSLSL